MERRRFITAASAVGATSIAGCLNWSNPKPEISAVYSEGTTLYAEITNAAQADKVVIEPVDGGEKSMADVTEQTPVATYSLGNPETIGTKQQKLAYGEELKVWIFVDGKGETASTTWTYSPEVQLIGIQHAEDAGYDPGHADQKATPVLVVKNSGDGPMKLQELVVLDINKPVPLTGENSESVAFAHTAIARQPGESGISAVSTHTDGDFFLPEGFEAKYALDGFFTHSGAPPKQTATVDQRFDVSLRWLFNDIRYEVVAALSDGIIQSNGKSDYRFGTYSVETVRNANPLE